MLTNAAFLLLAIAVAAWCGCCTGGQQHQGLRRVLAWLALTTAPAALSAAVLAGMISGPALLVALLILLLAGGLQWQQLSALLLAGQTGRPPPAGPRLCDGLPGGSTTISSTGNMTGRALCWLLLALGSLALALHWPEGIANPLVLHEIRVSPDTVPYTLYANFDKGWAGFCLLLALLPASPGSMNTAVTGTISQGANGVSVRQLAAISLLTITLCMLLALALGLVRVDPKLPAFLATFVFCNLLLTCVAEEAFFRGMLQQGLAQLCRQRGVSPLWACGLAALLFGLAHLGGGWAYVLVATLAGLGYGWIYQQSGRLLAAILLHFLLNLTHLLLFSYPMLQQSFAAN